MKNTWLYLFIFSALITLESCGSRTEQGIGSDQSVLVNVTVTDKFGVPTNTFVRGDSLAFKVNFINQSIDAKTLKYRGPIALLTISKKGPPPEVVFVNNVLELSDLENGTVKQITILPGETYTEAMFWPGINNVKPEILYSSNPFVEAGSYSFVITGSVSTKDDPNPIQDGGFVLADGNIVISQ